MTRKEIIDKAKNYQGDKLSFVDGAEWMQSVGHNDSPSLVTRRDYGKSIDIIDFYNQYCV